MFLTLSYLAKDVLPNTSLYNIKRLQENIVLITKFSPEQKAEYYSYLLDLRLKELELLTARKNEHQLILPSALRYSTNAGEYTQVIKENNLISHAEKARDQFEKHSSTLKRLLATYPRKDVGDRGDTFIIDSVNYLIIYEKELPQ